MRRSGSCLPTAIALLLCLATRAGAASAARTPVGDTWGVRATGQGLQSLSDVNTGKPARRTPLRTQPIATRRHGGIAIELLADSASAARLRASARAYAPELDKAIDWLQRLRPPRLARARIVLTLIAPTHHTRLERTHPANDGTVVDLLVPMPAGVPSAAVGKAVATALHEISHAFNAGGGPRLARRDDEYRASLVESCYLADTLRVGDTLQLSPRAPADAAEYFVTAQSRDAARDAVADLVRAAGTGTVRWDDPIALLGLKLACGVRLAQAP